MTTNDYFITCHVKNEVSFVILPLITPIFTNNFIHLKSYFEIYACFYTIYCSFHAFQTTQKCNDSFVILIDLSILMKFHKILDFYPYVTYPLYDTLFNMRPVAHEKCLLEMIVFTFSKILHLILTQWAPCQSPVTDAKLSLLGRVSHRRLTLNYPFLVASVIGDWR